MFPNKKGKTERNCDILQLLWMELDIVNNNRFINKVIVDNLPKQNYYKYISMLFISLFWLVNNITQPGLKNMHTRWGIMSDERTGSPHFAMKGALVWTV